MRFLYTLSSHGGPRDNGCLKAYWDVMDQCPGTWMRGTQGLPQVERGSYNTSSDPDPYPALFDVAVFMFRL